MSPKIPETPSNSAPAKSPNSADDAKDQNSNPTNTSTNSENTTTQSSTPDTVDSADEQPFESQTDSESKGDGHDKQETKSRDTQEAGNTENKVSEPKVDVTKKQDRKRKRADSEKESSKKAKAKYLKPSDEERAPAKKGVKDESKLKVVLTRTDGNKEVFDYKPRNFKIEDFDFNDPAWIKRLNPWRQQRFRRATGKARDSRFRWTRFEERTLQKVIAKEISRTKSKKNMDWKRVRQDYNAAVAGKIRKKGQEYAETKDASKTSRMTKKVNDSGSYSSRTITALKKQAEKYASMDAVLSRVIPRDWELNEDELDESSEDESELDTDAEADSDSESDNGLEEDSDDEIGGQRPAGNANEGTLVSAV